jgi:hypothetical protein
VGWQRRLGWRATKGVMVWVARVMATVMKWAMATDSDNSGYGYGKEAVRQATAETMAMGMGMVQRTWSLTL